MTLSSVPTEGDIELRKKQQITSLFLTPIAVYGKVVDEDGSPVADATVEVGVNDSPIKSSTNYSKVTDGDGFFSLTGVHGISFSLRASKQGYYTTQRSRGQRNMIAPANEDVPQPTESQPVVLVLRKHGQTVPLISASSRQINIPTNGQPINIDLKTGRAGRGDLQIESWIGDSDQRRFEWRYRLSVPGGGLVKRNGQFDFEAPIGDYQSAIEVNMTADAEKWTSDVRNDYFAKLPDGRHARFSINLYPGKRNFVVIESYVSLTPGDRNLEVDPSKASKPEDGPR